MLSTAMAAFHLQYTAPARASPGHGQARVRWMRIVQAGARAAATAQGDLGRGGNAVRGGRIVGQVQALVRFAFIGADFAGGVQQQEVNRHLELLPQLIALRVGEENLAHVLQHEDRAARFDAAHGGLCKVVKGARHGGGMPVGR